jgi:hypothetical protein
MALARKHVTDPGPGLFTPNAGAHIRDEQRRRRSQFDRGTRHAAMEEFEHYQFYTGQ